MAELVAKTIEKRRKHPLAECERCPLYEKGTFVPSAQPLGNSNGLAFIGESPGTKEKQKKIPFIGPSGQLLNKALEVNGIRRDESLLTNAALCNYRDEDKDSLPEAIDACRPRLLTELSDNNISTAVVLGNAAVSSLLVTKQGITKLRGGGPKESPYSTKFSVIPTFHPAAILRNHGQMPLLLSDIAKTKPQPKLWVEPTIVEITDKSKALNVLRNTKTTQPIVVDVETGTEKEESYNRTTNLLCVGLGSTAPNHNNVVVVIGRPAIYSTVVQDELIKLLLRTGVICQNGKFDCYILSLINRQDEEIYLVDDTMLKSYSLNENPGTHGLKYMGEEYLGTPAWGEEIKPYLHAHVDPPELVEWARQYLHNALPIGMPYDSDDDVFRADILKPLDKKEQGAIKRAAVEMGVEEYQGTEGMKYASRIRWMLPTEAPLLSPSDADGSYASIPPKLLHKYNAYDVQVTRMLKILLDKQQEANGLVEANKHLMIMSNALMRIERNGLKLDYDFNTTLYDQFTEYLEKLNVFSFNPGSWQQLRKYLLDTFNVEMGSTDEDHIKELMAHPRASQEIVTFCEQLLEYRRWTKLRSTYVTSVRNLANDNGGVLLPTFKIDQATTGRLASKNPNVQNMPREFDIKRQFIPSTRDRVFIHADYGQLELRVITWLAQDESMRALFNDPDRDLFDELTQVVFSMDRDEFYYKKQHDEAFIKERRVVVKAFAYGIILDRSAEGIASDQKVGIDIPTAREKMAIFKKQIPGIIKFQEQVKRDVLNGKDLINVFGRRRRFHLITNQNRQDVLRQAVAFQPQSTASDICVTAASRLPKWMDPRNIIHDDILLEAPRDEAPYHAEVLARIMRETAEEVCDGYVKFEAKPEIGEHWGNMIAVNKWVSNNQ